MGNGPAFLVQGASPPLIGLSASFSLIGVYTACSRRIGLCFSKVVCCRRLTVCSESVVIENFKFLVSEGILRILVDFKWEFVNRDFIVYVWYQRLCTIFFFLLS